MVSKTEVITTQRQAQLMITDIEDNADVCRWVLAMMKAIRNGVDFFKNDTFCAVEALTEDMEKHCRREGIDTIIMMPKNPPSSPSFVLNN